MRHLALVLKAISSITLDTDRRFFPTHQHHHHLWRYWTTEKNRMSGYLAISEIRQQIRKREARTAIDDHADRAARIVSQQQHDTLCKGGTQKLAVRDQQHASRRCGGNHRQRFGQQTRIGKPGLRKKKRSDQQAAQSCVHVDLPARNPDLSGLSVHNVPRHCAKDDAGALRENAMPGTGWMNAVPEQVLVRFGAERFDLGTRCNTRLRNFGQIHRGRRGHDFVQDGEYIEPHNVKTERRFQPAEQCSQLIVEC